MGADRLEEPVERRVGERDVPAVVDQEGRVGHGLHEGGVVHQVVALRGVFGQPVVRGRPPGRRRVAVDHDPEQPEALPLAHLQGFRQGEQLAVGPFLDQAAFPVPVGAHADPQPGGEVFLAQAQFLAALAQNLLASLRPHCTACGLLARQALLTGSGEAIGRAHRCEMWHRELPLLTVWIFNFLWRSCYRLHSSVNYRGNSSLLTAHSRHSCGKFWPCGGETARFQKPTMCPNRLAAI
ncbi:hypothetical protein GCM10010286_65090 [Streptomyces toxytricini]|nr:hypothetical protein GCM10010286_65090 [Streptomyces toxytricini]